MRTICSRHQVPAAMLLSAIYSHKVLGTMSTVLPNPIRWMMMHGATDSPLQDLIDLLRNSTGIDARWDEASSSLDLGNFPKEDRALYRTAVHLAECEYASAKQFKRMLLRAWARVSIAIQAAASALTLGIATSFDLLVDETVLNALFALSLPGVLYCFSGWRLPKLN